MATQKNDTGAGQRKIIGAIIQNGHIYKAGEEDALAGALSESDIHRLQSSGQLEGDWSVQASGASSASDETDSDEEEGLPPLSGMADHLAGIESVDDVKAMRKTDKRKGAKPLYEARIAELEGSGEEG